MTWTTTTTGVIWQPPTDVYETASEFVVRVEVGGIDPENVEISLADRVISISGLRRDPASKVGYHRMEIFYGPFQTRAILPRRVDSSRIQAHYRDGFLTVVVPKSSPVRVRVENGETQNEGK